MAAVSKNALDSEAGRDDLFAYDVTLPTPLQIEDGLPLPLARGGFTPQASFLVLDPSSCRDNDAVLLFSCYLFVSFI